MTHALGHTRIDLWQAKIKVDLESAKSTRLRPICTRVTNSLLVSPLLSIGNKELVNLKKVIVTAGLAAYNTCMDC